MAANWETLQVGDGTTTQAYVASPDGPGPFPGVVISQHLGGIDQFIQETAVRLAGEGYVAIAPDLYHRLDPVEGESTPEKLLARLVNLTDFGVIADTNAAVDYLKASPLCTDGIGLVGFCMGGRIAYMMAGVNSGLKAVISFYGSRTKENWGTDPLPTPFERLADAYCPILGFFGEDDKDPTPEQMRELSAELARHAKPHEFHSYPNAAHAYMNYTNPQAYREDAAKASWPVAMEFFERCLAKAPAAS